MYDNKDITFNPGAKLLIGHAPTNQKIKGTKYIIDAVNSLKEKYPISLQIIENVNHKEALRMMKKCDIFIDQLLVGWYGGTAVEAMTLGKPVIVYIRESDVQLIPKEMAEELPFIIANPDTIYNVLDNVIKNRNMLRKYSERTYEFVKKYHSEKYILDKVLAEYLTESEL